MVSPSIPTMITNALYFLERGRYFLCDKPQGLIAVYTLPLSVPCVYATGLAPVPKVYSSFDRDDNERKLIIFFCFSSYRLSRSVLKLVRIVIGLIARKAGTPS
jgi:hypothetical protein